MLLPLLFFPYKSYTASFDFLRKLSNLSSAGPRSAAGTSSHLLRLPLPDKKTNAILDELFFTQNSAIHILQGEREGEGEGERARSHA